MFTSLTKQAMPVIRYRTRDLTRLLPGTARTMRRMQKITGRNDDMIILRGVNLFPTQIEELILGVGALAPQFQCVLERPERLDRLTVNVESRAGVDSAARAAAGEQLQQQVKNRIGVSVEVHGAGAGQHRALHGQGPSTDRQATALSAGAGFLRRAIWPCRAAGRLSPAHWTSFAFASAG